MTELELVREHVADKHTVTRLGCPVCADLPRQRAAAGQAAHTAYVEQTLADSRAARVALDAALDACQHPSHGGEDPRICNVCGAALD